MNVQNRAISWSTAVSVVVLLILYVVVRSWLFDANSGITALRETNPQKAIDELSRVVHWSVIGTVCYVFWKTFRPVNHVDEPSRNRMGGSAETPLP